MKQSVLDTRERARGLPGFFPIWFAGRLLNPEDRLQSRGKYFPFGEDRYNPNPANPSNDQEKFATYTRDSAAGLDYAYNRYYNTATGNFMNPDPDAGSGVANSPQTLNRYTYAGGDPVTNMDPLGTFFFAGGWNCYDFGYDYFDGFGPIDGDDGGWFPGYGPCLLLHPYLPIYPGSLAPGVPPGFPTPECDITLVTQKIQPAGYPTPFNHTFAEIQRVFNGYVTSQ